MSLRGFFNRKRLAKLARIQLFFILAIFLAGFFLYAPQSPIANQTHFTQIKEVRAATGGPNSTGTGASVAGTCGADAFNTPANIVANDANLATITGTAFDSGNITNELRASNFGFSIPNGSIIDGVQVEIVAWGGAVSTVLYNKVQLFTTPGTNVGNNKSTGAALPGADPGTTYTSFGATNDLWGTTFTEAQVESANFGVAFCFAASGNNRTMNVDHIRITVGYTPFTISGTCKQRDESTNCADSESVRFAINGTLANTGADTTATTSAGAFTITPATAPISGDVITVFLNTVADNLEATAVTKWDGSGAITGINLIEGSLSIGSDDNQSLTNTNLGQYDGSVSADEDIFFDNMSAGTCDGSAGFTGLCADYGTAGAGQFSFTEQIYIKASNTYASGGNVRTAKMDIRGTYSPGSGITTLFGSGTTDTTCTATTDMPLCKTAGGTLTAGGATTIEYVSSTDTNIPIEGLTYATLILSPVSGTPTYTLGDAASQTLTATTLTIGQGSTGTVTGATNNPAINVSGVLTVASNAIFTTGSGTITLSGTSTPLVVSGTFTASTNNTVNYRGNGASTIKATTYYNLGLMPSSSSQQVLASGTFTINGNLTIGDGTASHNGATGTANDPTINVTGNVAIAANATFTAPDAASNIVSVGGSWANSGTFTHSSNTVKFTSTAQLKTINGGASNFYNVTFDGTGGSWSAQTNTLTIDNDLTMTHGQLDTNAAVANTTIKGNVKCGATCGDILLTGGTFTQTVTANKAFGTDVAVSNSWEFNNLTFTATSNTITTSSVGTGLILVDGVLTISASTTLAAGNRSWALAGSGTPFINSGTFTANTSTFEYAGATATVTATTFNNLTLENSGTFTLPAADITLRGNLIVSSGVNVTKSASNKLIFAKGSTGQTITDSSGNAPDLGIIQVSANGTATTLNMGSAITVTSLTVDTSQFFSANGSNTLTLTGTGTPLSVSGTFTASTGTVRYTGNGSTTISAVAYNNLTIDPTITATQSYTFNATSVSGNLTVQVTKTGVGTVPFTVTMGANLVVGGTTLIQKVSGTVSVEFTTNVSGNYSVTTNDLDIETGGTLTANASSITINRNLTLGSGGGFDQGTGIVHLATTTAAAITTGNGSMFFYDLDIPVAAAGKTVRFQNATGCPGACVPIIYITHNLTAVGTSGAHTTVRSGSNGSQWIVNFTSPQASGNFTYIDLYDSGCDPAGTQVADMSGTGNFNGTNNDSSCWSFVAGITIAGSSNGTGTVAVAVNGSLQSGKTATIGGSAWSITGVAAPSAGAIITVWIDGVANSAESTAIAKYDGTTDIAGMVLNVNTLTIGSTSDGSQSLTVANLDLYDCTADGDIMHQAASSALGVQGASCAADPTDSNATSNTYTDETISILANYTLTIGGTETLTTDNLTNAGTLTSGGNSAYSVSGNWANSSTFTPSTSTVTFNATDSGHAINNGASSFTNVIFNGSGGVWSPNTNTMTVAGDLTVTAGTLDGSTGTPSSVTVNGDVKCGVTCGTINFTATNTFTQSVASAKNFGTNVAVATNWSFFNLTFTASPAATITTSSTGTGSITVAGTLTVSASTTLDAGNRTWILSAGSGATPLSVSGTFTANSSTFQYTGNTATLTGTTFNNLTLGGTGTYTLPAADVTLRGNLVITSTANVTKSASNKLIFAKGGTQTLTDSSGNAPNLGAVQISANGGASTLNLGSSVKLTSLTISASQNFSANGSNTLTLTGTGTPLSIGASAGFTPSTGTVTYAPASSSAVTVAATTYHHLIFNSSSTTFTLAGAIVSDAGGNITITAGTLDTSSGNNYGVTVGGNLSTSGLFLTRSALVTFNGGSSQTITANGSPFYDLTFNNALGEWSLVDGLFVDHVLTITAGNLNAGSQNVLLSGSGTPFVNNGTFTQGTSSVQYYGSLGTNIAALNGSGSTNAYYNLKMDSDSGDEPADFTLLGDTTIQNVLTIGAAAAPVVQTLHAGSTTLTLAGSTTPLNIIADKGVFDAGTGTVQYTSGSGVTALSSVPMATGSDYYNNLIINGSGTFNFTDSILTQGNLTITAGTLATTSANLEIHGEMTGNGSVNFSGGDTSIFTPIGNFGGDTSWIFNTLQIGEDGTNIINAIGTGAVTVGGQLSFILDQFNAGGKTWTLSGTTGTPLALVAGSFDPGTSTFVYTGNNTGGNTTVAPLTYNNLTVNNASETYVLAGATTTNSDFTITAGALDTVNAQNYALNIGGVYTNNGTFTARLGTVTFTSDVGTKNLSGTLNGTSAFYNLHVDGDATFAPQSAMLVSNDLQVNAGTLSGANNITINGGDATGNGVINMTAGTFLVDGTGDVGGSLDWNFYDITFGDGTGTATTTNIGDGSNLIVAHVMTIAANQTYEQGANNVILTASGTPLIMNGTFSSVSGGSITYSGTAASNIASAPYGSLILAPASGTPTYTLGTISSQSISVLSYFECSSATINVDTYDPTLAIGTFINVSCPWIKSNSATLTISPVGAGITDANVEPQDIGFVLVSGGYTPLQFNTNIKATTMTVSSGKELDLVNHTLTLTGNGGAVLVNDGTFTPGTSTVEFIPAATTGVTVPALTYYNLKLNKAANTFTAASGTLTAGGDMDVIAGTLDLTANDPVTAIGGTLTIAGTVLASNSASLTISGDLINNGTFTHNSGTVAFDTSSDTSVGGSNAITFYNLTANAAGKTIEFPAGSNPTIAGTFTLTGENGQPVKLMSDTPTSRWFITLSGTANFSYVFVIDAGCTSSNNIGPFQTMVDGGNNASCWKFIKRGANVGSSGGGPGSGGSSGGGGTSGGGSGSGGSGGGSGGSSSCTTTATGTAVLNSGAVASVTMVCKGSGYSTVPTVTFSGDGSGASGTAVLTSGTVTSVTINAGGSNYSVPPTVTFSAPGAGGGGGGTPP